MLVSGHLPFVALAELLHARSVWHAWNGLIATVSSRFMKSLVQMKVDLAQVVTDFLTDETSPSTPAGVKRAPKAAGGAKKRIV